MILLGLCAAFLAFLLYWLRAPAKKQPDALSNDFSAFIKAKPAVATKETTNAPTTLAAHDGKPRVPILVLFGSEYGCSKENAALLADKLVALDYRPQVVDMAQLAAISPSDSHVFEDVQVMLVLCSTHGDGVPPAPARAFIEKLPHVESFSGYFSVLAFGDKAYLRYCQCGRELDAILERIGGKRLAPRGEVDREDPRAIAAWHTAVFTALPTLELQKTTSSTCMKVTSVSHTQPPLGSCKENPFLARVTAVRALTNTLSPEDRDTHHVEFDVARMPLRHEPGDALGVLPTNNSIEVQRVLTAARLNGDALVKVPDWAPIGDQDAATPAQQATCTLITALSRYYDLRQPRLALYTTVGIRTAAQGEHQSDDRHVADLLALARPSLTLTPEALLALLRPLTPRLYSISSAALVAENTVSIAVASVRYVAGGRAREGVASTQLCERTQLGDVIPIFIQANPDFRMPASISTPIIMVGPGTGLAPFRAFLQDRFSRARTLPYPVLATTMLFFGCRHRDRDFLYQAELEAWAADGLLDLHVAFSRQQPDRKDYVQDHLKKHAVEVSNVVRAGGHIYVCGDANNMAPQVEAVLSSILSEAQMPCIDELRATRRYQRDVWFG
eukprot:m.42083 g.42083  ORF g.42083 m.42083 type:complete len:616 (+) comp10604_c0_seq1:3-1850(+)